MNSKTTPKDFFLHLAATVILYSAVVALIDLAFSVINYALPDQLASYFAPTSIVWPVSMLIVLVPLLYVIEWAINRDIALMPEKKEIWVRRWRIYLTLFLTLILVSGDLIALLNVFLSGEITARFVYKVLVILLVAGAVGKYYFFSISEKWKWAGFVRRGNAWFGIIMVVAAIVSGFLIVGSPAKQRDLRFDAQRISDLSTIQWQIVSQWQQKGAIPPTLDGLADSISGFAVPHDPSTNAPYEYIVKGKTSFDLCATFALASQDASGRGAYGEGYSTGIAYPTYPSPIGTEGDSWAHPAGRACFTRTIDPSRYPVSPKSASVPESAY